MNNHYEPEFANGYNNLRLTLRGVYNRGVGFSTDRGTKESQNYYGRDDS